MSIVILFAIRWVTLQGAAQTVIALGQQLLQGSPDPAACQKGKPNNQTNSPLSPFPPARSEGPTARLRKVRPLKPAGDLWFFPIIIVYRELSLLCAGMTLATVPRLLEELPAHWLSRPPNLGRSSQKWRAPCAQGRTSSSSSIPGRGTHSARYNVKEASLGCPGGSPLG